MLFACSDGIVGFNESLSLPSIFPESQSMSALSKINASGLSLEEKEHLKLLVALKPHIGRQITDDDQVTDSLLRKYMTGYQLHIFFH